MRWDILWMLSYDSQGKSGINRTQGHQHPPRLGADAPHSLQKALFWAFCITLKFSRKSLKFDAVAR